MPDYTDLAWNLRAPLIGLGFQASDRTRDLGRGTAFPSSSDIPGGLQADDRFYRTDLDWLCVYDGARWLTAHEYQVQMGFFDNTTITYTVTTTAVRLATMRSDYAPYFTRAEATPGIGATNSGINYWTFTARIDTGTAIWTFNTSADSPSTNPKKNTSTFTQPGVTTFFLYLDLATVGTPTGIIPRFPTFYYRFIVP